jgi:hypothetical protein
MLAGVSMLAGVPLLAGIPLLMGARWCAFSGFVPKVQWYQQMSWFVGEKSGVLQRNLNCERWRSLDCERLRVCEARNDATWRASYSIRSSSTAVFSGVAGEMLSVVG